MNKGQLFLIPTTLGDNEPLEVLPISVKKTIENTTHFIVENEKTARRFIKKITPNKLQASLVLYPLNKFTKDEELINYLNATEAGENIGLISEAGLPAIADPGAVIVKLAHEKNIKVTPLVGPSSILMALMSSGMNGQNFAFNGYLPIEVSERKKAIKYFERLSNERNQAQIFIETPYRNEKLFAEMKNSLNGETRLCIGVDISLETAWIKTKTVNEWKKATVALHKRPAIFIIEK
jgi:16S rRNA (cytidine1402-2'-O)-methyltransferase